MSVALDRGVWKCHSCGDGGGPWLLRAHLLGTRTAPPPPALPMPSPKASTPPPFDVDAAWRELYAACDPDDAGLWATQQRGWGTYGEHVAYTLIGVAVRPRDARAMRALNRPAQRLARLGGDEDVHDVMLPLRDLSGRVVTVVRRWGGRGEKPAVKSLSPSSKLEWGFPSPGVYGRLPEAVDAAVAGATLVLCEGAPDALAVEAWGLHEHVPIVALGLYSDAPDNIRTAARAIADRVLSSGGALVNAIVISDAPRTPTYPPGSAKYEAHIAKQEATAAAWVDAVDILGAAGHARLLDLRSIAERVDPAGRAASGFDLADLLRADVDGRASFRDVLQPTGTGGQRHPPTMPFDDARAELRTRLAETIAWATTADTANTPRLALVRADTGLGKTYAALTAMGAYAAAGHRALVTFANYALLAEKAAEARRLCPDTPLRVIQGIEHVCDWFRPGGQGGAGLRPKLHSVLAESGRRGLCGDASDPRDRCPKYMTCPGPYAPRPVAGELTLGVHAIAGHLGGPADLLVIDESPGVVDEIRVEPASVAAHTLPGAHPAAVRWLPYNPSARRMALVVQAVATALAADVVTARLDGGSGHAMEVQADVLYPALAAQLAGVDLSTWWTTEREPPPPPSWTVRSGSVDLSRTPGARTWRHLRSLAAAATGRTLAPDDPVWSVAVATDGTWALVGRRPRHLPASPIIVLDGTIDLERAAWRAAYDGRLFHDVDIAAIGATPAAAIHIAPTRAVTSSDGVRLGPRTPDRGYYSRAAMLGGEGPRPVAFERLAEVFALTLAALPNPAPPGARIGLITYEPLATAMVIGGAIDLGGKRPTTSPRGPGAPVVATLTAAGYQLVAGYYGRDERGRNDLAHAAAVVAFGDPVPNLDAVAADAASLGLVTPTEGADAREIALRQALARARHAERSDGERAVLVYAGFRAPTMRGVVWTPVPPPATLLPDGTPRPTLREAVVALRADMGDDVTVDDMRAHDWSDTPWADLDIAGMDDARLGRAVGSAQNA